MSPLALAWQQFRFERKLFWRNPSAAFFNFLLPLLLLVLTASAFSADPDELEILIPGIAGMGVLATTFTSLAFNITILRDDGVLKRWRGTPMPAGSYMAGLLASAALNAFAQVLLVVAIGNLVYGVDWPQDPMLLVLFTALGVVCFAALGIAFSHAIPNEDAAPAYTNAVFLPTIFISGVFYSSDDLPDALKAIAEALPLKHLIDGLSEAIVGGGGDAGTAALVVGGVDRGRAGPGGALFPLGVSSTGRRSTGDRGASAPGCLQPQRVPVPPQPALVLAPVRHPLREQDPEALRVVEHVEVHDLVLDDVVEHRRGRQQQPPVEAHRPGRRARRPARALAADLQLRVGRAPARAGGVQPRPHLRAGAAAVPALERVAHGDPGRQRQP